MAGMTIRYPRRHDFSAMKLFFPALLLALVYAPSLQAEEAPDYTRDVAPVLRKYCAGCHNAEEANGEFRLDSYAQLFKGGDNGPALIAGDEKVSRMVRMLTGDIEPQMPPEDEAQPTADEIALITKWIDAGAKGPAGAEPTPTLVTPTIKPQVSKPQATITSATYSPDGKLLALARFKTVEIRDAKTNDLLHKLEDHPGKVNDLAFSHDGTLLLAATGVTGLYGKVVIWDLAADKLATGKPAGEIQGHRDVLYAVAVTPDGQRIATGSYDKQVIIWDAQTKKPIHTLTQHNGAIFDLAFSPDGHLLASASADETVKIWNVETGQRLDTLGQPEGEQYAVLFSPDGKRVIAGGADNRIRVWKIISRDKPRINPLLHARFAHEGAVVALAWNPQQNILLSAAEDRTLKAWETKTFTETKLFDEQSDVVTSLAASQQKSQFLVARIDGTFESYSIPESARDGNAHDNEDIVTNVGEAASGEMQTVAEAEPNNEVSQAQSINVPATASGVIHSSDAEKIDIDEPDVDLYRFSATKGQQWIIETKAARLKSPLDTKIEVLDADGNRITRVLLQAVRDSYFTFRGKDSTQTNDFRVHNWEEMQLNQLLYAQGEVVKLFHYPRGPDSGYDVYPKFGNRHTWFDTTSVSHALGEPCYIVEPHAPDAKIIPNGLPVFPIYFENDDDAQRKLGTDSRLTFTAPEDGEYLIKVSDAVAPQPAANSSADKKYELTIRPPKPDFNVRVEGGGMTVNRSSGKMFTLKCDRIDNFNGEIQLEITGVPDGFYVPSPLTIEAGHYTALGAVYAFPDAADPPSDAWQQVKITATAKVGGQDITKQIGNLGDVKLAGEPKLLLSLSPKDAEPVPLDAYRAGEIPEITIAPGETLETTLRVTRQGNNGVLAFGKEDAGRNLPHGLYVDNIGLNGVLLLAGQNQRTVFITADSWVQPTSRLFFLKSDQEGGQCSWPIRVKVE